MSKQPKRAPAKETPVQKTDFKAIPPEADKLVAVPESSQDSVNPERSHSPVNPQSSPDSESPDRPKEDTGAPEAESQPSDPATKRRPAWRSSLAAFQYLSALKKDEDVRIRDSDRSSGLFLLLSCVITLLAMFVPVLQPGRLPLVVLSDVIVGVMLAIYIINRFGILSTLNKRQALLASQLLIGTAFFGVFIALNIAAIIAMIVMIMNPRAF